MLLTDFDQTCIKCYGLLSSSLWNIFYIRIAFPFKSKDQVEVFSYFRQAILYLTPLTPTDQN